MEDVLEVYHRPRDPLRPVVCFDETSKQLIIETRAPLPAAPGRKARHDYEYERNFSLNCRANAADPLFGNYTEELVYPPVGLPVFDSDNAVADGATGVGACSAKNMCLCG